MASSIASTVREHGAIDVRIDGSLTRSWRVVTAQTTSVRLRMVFALFETDQIDQAASSCRDSEPHKQRLLP